jgi:hypothetical protein
MTISIPIKSTNPNRNNQTKPKGNRAQNETGCTNIFIISEVF